MFGPPTDKQLAYLRDLKYEGPVPSTKREASLLIDAITTATAKAKESGKTFGGLTPSQVQKLRDKSSRAWLKERRKEVREQSRLDLSDHRELERDLRSSGGVDRKDRFAGWLLKIGGRCEESKHLQGLLVTAEDAKADLGLLPPYDTCQEVICECDIEPVAVGEVPKGTTVAERDVPEGAEPPAAPQKKAGCSTVILAVVVVIVALWVVVAH